MGTVPAGAAAAPPAIPDGLWLIATKWLEPIVTNILNMEVSVQVVVGGHTFNRVFRLQAGDIASAYQQLVNILNGTAAAYGVPLQGAAGPTSISQLALISYLQSQVG
jgi:hypothetical protein